MKHFVKHLGKVPLRASSEFNGEGVEISNGISCVTDLLAYMMVAMAGAAPGQTVADAWSGQGDVQEASAPAIRVRSADEHNSLLEKINRMLASSAGLAKSVRATHVERSNTDPSTIIARTNILGNNTALSIHTNGSHTSAVFTEVSPGNRPALMPTDYDYFTFGGVDGIKMTAQVLNGTLAQSAYVEDLVHLTQDFLESTTDGFYNSDTWTYQFCNRTSFSPLFYGRIIAEQTVPEQRLGYEDATPFNCSTTTV
ncbi:hypothetical protein LTR01_009188 [Friedmanniomyces endolithicus]|nr:hypothetical protein LTR01_009188 [Friedmanniomyces endolithicus]KAK0822608.1 hypothetical protein LTR73_009186 [Friedmanniomyces endolithicus]